MDRNAPPSGSGSPSGSLVLVLLVLLAAGGTFTAPVFAGLDRAGPAPHAPAGTERDGRVMRVASPEPEIRDT